MEHNKESDNRSRKETRLANCCNTNRKKLRTERQGSGVSEYCSHEIHETSGGREEKQEDLTSEEKKGEGTLLLPSNLLRRRDAFLVSLTPPPVSLSITLSMTLSIFPSFSSDDDCSRREETGARGTIISLGEESCVNFSLSLFLHN